jgi:succinate dehydrogenase / fumarate reductase iron-sulfur subunit
MMKLTLQIWRQKNPADAGRFVTYEMNSVSPDMSFLEMLDALNEELVSRGEEPVAFDHDCREGICGSCGVVINGAPHGPRRATTACQLHMRSFRDGDTVVIEPWRARAFPVIRDLVVDRSAFDRIIQAGGYISAPTGTAPDANAIPIPKRVADQAFDAATCIGCGACVAACPNGSAMLYTAAKIAHLGLLPQGQPERRARVLNMTREMDEEGFGACSNHAECEAACPKEISIRFIAAMNRDYIRSCLTG